VHVHTRVHCLILPLFPYVCWSVVERTLHRVALIIIIIINLLAVISGSLSPQHGASSGCGWRNGLQYGG
jgi:hypothetical protein